MTAPHPETVGEEGLAEEPEPDRVRRAEGGERENKHAEHPGRVWHRAQHEGSEARGQPRADPRRVILSARLQQDRCKQRQRNEAETAQDHLELGHGGILRGRVAGGAGMR